MGWPYFESMGTLELWTGLPGSERRKAAADEALLTASGGGPVWWLVDRLRGVERVEKLLLKSSNGVCAGIEVVTASGLPHFILSKSNRQFNPVPSDLRELIIREILAGGPWLKSLGIDLTPGWTGRIATIRTRIGDDPDLQRQLRGRYPWIREIIAEYDRLLAESGRIDESDLPKVASEAIESRDFLPPELMVVDRLGPLAPSLVETMHKAAVRAGRAIVIADSIGVSAPALSLTSMAIDNWRRLQAVEERRFNVAEGRRVLAENLFVVRKPEVAADFNSIGIHGSFHIDAASETRRVAKEISRLLHDEGLRSEQIGVAVTRLDDYVRLIEEIFPRYGVHPDIRLGLYLGTSPVARLVVSLFDLRAKGLPRECLTDVLLNPYVSWGSALNADESVLEFDRAARSARIVAGRGDVQKEWLEPLRGEVDSIRKRAEFQRDSAHNEKVPSQNRSANLLSHAEWLEAAMADFKAFSDHILALSDNCSADQAVSWLESILDLLSVRLNILKLAEENPSLGSRELGALNEVRLILGMISDVSQLNGTRVLPVTRFSELVRFAVGRTRQAPRSNPRGGVPVFGALDIRGFCGKSLFFMGLTSGSWPRKPTVDFIQPFSSTWHDKVDRLSESRELMLEALLSAERLFLTAPCPEGGEGLEAPSPIIADLKDAGVSIQPWPEDDNFRSAFDLLVETGKTISQPDTKGAAIRRISTAKAQMFDMKRTILWERAVQAYKIELNRSNPRRLTRYDGMLGDALVTMKLGGPLSISRLETYAKCPMRYLFRYVLNLEELKDLDEEVDAASTGRIVHRIMSESMKILRGHEGMAGSFASDPTLTARILDEVAEREIARYPYDNLIWDRVVQSIKGGLTDNSEEKGFLRLALDHEESRLSGEQVVYVEASFGQEENPEGDILQRRALSLDSDEGSVEIVGRIDRISLDSKKGWRVWDYKRSDSQMPTARKIRNGTHFQLAVYLMVLEDFLSRHGNRGYKVNGAGFYQIRRDGVGQTGNWSYDDHTAECSNLHKHILGIDKAIRAGRFHQPLSQHADLCPEYRNTCTYRRICRKNNALFAAREKSIENNQLKDAYRLAFQRFSSEKGHNE